MTDIILTGKECAAMLKIEYGYFMRVVRYQPGFPPDLELYKNGRRRWCREDVETWALRNRKAA